MYMDLTVDLYNSTFDLYNSTYRLKEHFWICCVCVIFDKMLIVFSSKQGNEPGPLDSVQHSALLLCKALQVYCIPILGVIYPLQIEIHS